MLWSCQGLVLTVLNSLSPWHGWKIVIGYKNCRYFSVNVESICNYFHDFRRPVRSGIKNAIAIYWLFIRHNPNNRPDTPCISPVSVVTYPFLTAMPILPASRCLRVLSDGAIKQHGRWRQLAAQDERKQSTHPCPVLMYTILSVCLIIYLPRV